MYRIEPYSKANSELWDNFVKSARNSTFLFLRNYIDYHADRFKDCSWMAYKNNKLVALLPANITADGVLHSHQGLTYGGWILPQGHINASDMLDIFQEAMKVWKSCGITSLDYKSLPYIYMAAPSDDAEYSLFRLGARLTEANVSSAIPLTQINKAGEIYNKLRRRLLAKTESLDFNIYETADAALMMHLIEECLSDRHNATPVHTALEMQNLKQMFPDNIHFWMLEYDNAPQATVCIYDTGRVAHAQYIASTPLARNLSLLTPLFHHLITEVYATRAYFDFGTSNENHGLHLNHGLLRQKSSFGASALLHRRFSLDIR